MENLSLLRLNPIQNINKVLEDYEVHCKLTMSFYVFLRKFHEQINIIKTLNTSVYQT